MRRGRRERNPGVEDSDESEDDMGEYLVQRMGGFNLREKSKFFGNMAIGNEFVPGHLSKQPRSKSVVPKEPKQEVKNLQPDLSILKKLLTIETLIEFPKLSLMVYEAIKPYI